MNRYQIVLLLGLGVTVVSGCHYATVGAFDITDVTLVTGSSQNPDLIECHTLVDEDLVVSVNGDPYQPPKGDWYESGSPYRGKLVEPGAHAYRCATARVTLQRNPSVAPGETWDTGDRIDIRVVAPHFCGNLHPGEDRLQPLLYSQQATSDGQTEFIFDSVIVASECGVGPYAEEYGEGHTVHLGQWPDGPVGNPLKGWGSTNQLDCLLMAGWHMNFATCGPP